LLPADPEVPMTDSKHPRTTTLRIPRAEVRQALVEGFHTGRLPALPETVAQVFSRVDDRSRAALLRTLLLSVGPLGLGVLAAGRFAKHMFRERWGEVPLSLDELSQVSAGQVAEIARYVEQRDPSIVNQLSSWLASDSGALVALGAGTFALLLQFIIERRRSPCADTASAANGSACADARASDRDWLDD
jgi:hypothetical protein